MNVADGVGLYHDGPFKVPPELGSKAICIHGGEAGVPARYAEGDARYDVCNWARFGSVGSGHGLLDEAEVVVHGSTRRSHQCEGLLGIAIR